MKKTSDNAWESRTHRVEVQARALGGRARLYVRAEREHRDRFGKTVKERYWRMAGEFETAEEAMAAAKGTD